MNKYISKLISKYKDRYCIPKEYLDDIINKQSKHLLVVMSVLLLFSISWLLLLFITSTNPQKNDSLKFTFYFFLLTSSLLIDILLLVVRKNKNRVIYNLANILTLLLITFLCVMCTFISSTNVVNFVFFVFIVILIGITFCYFDPLSILTVTLVSFLRLFFLFIDLGLGVCAFNSILSLIVINILNFYKMRTSVESLKKSINLSKQNYQLNEQTIELNAQKNELIRLKNKLENTVESQEVKLNSQNEKIIHLQNHTIKSLSNLVESRDKDTGLHVFRTSAYVRMIGEEAFKRGIYPEEITLEFISIIESAAPLHDIGKILVSDTVLKKPERLTTEEYEQIKIHTSEGYKIVSSVLSEQDDTDYIKHAIEIATYHHEKWDGTGYPEGLKHEEIPVSARIMAIADVFDALVCKRCYKDAMTVDEAFAIIRNSRNTHFDPVLADVFLDCKSKVVSIMNQYKD